jgi:hypothetical protein
MGQYRALLVANSKFYVDPERFPELKAPIYDMARLEDALIHPEFGLFEREHVRLLPNARASDILVTMEDFFQSADAEDTMLLYYSGHGKLDINNNFFLCAADTRMDRLMSTAVRDEQVNAMMRSSPARTFVLILDCCSSGAWKSPTELLPDTLKGSGRFLLSSSRAGQNSGDAGVETESSAFTKLLVEAMEEADLDTDQDGYVDIDEIYKHVEKHLRVSGQQAQRDFGKSARSVALARRSLAPKGSESAPAPAVGPEEPPNITVTPERIQISGARSEDLPLVERVYVFNRGGGSLSWSAESDDAWISLEPHQEFVKVSLSPPSGGTHRGSIYVHEQGGAVKRVRVAVHLADEPQEDRPSPPTVTPVLTDQEEDEPKKSRRRKGVLVAAAGSLLALIVAITAIVMTSGTEVPGDGGSPTSKRNPDDAPPTALLNWKAGKVTPGIGGPAWIYGITRGRSTDTEPMRYVAVGTDGSRAAIWRYGDGQWQGETIDGETEAVINGITKWRNSFIAVGWSTSEEGDTDAAVWTVPIDGGGASRIGEESLGASGHQVINKIFSGAGFDLVAVGRDGRHGAIWSSSDDGYTWESEWDSENGSAPPDESELLRVQKFEHTNGGDEVLIAVGYEETEGDKDGVVWKETEADRWVPIARFDGEGDQVITDVTSSTPGELVAVGYTSDEATDELDAVVWRSRDDGKNWTVSKGDFEGPGDQRINRVLSQAGERGPLRFIAGGYDESNGDLDASLWYSEDAITWRKETVARTRLEGAGDQVILALGYVSYWERGNAPKVLALGVDEERAAIWAGREIDL